MKIHPAAAPRYDRLFDPATAMLVAGGVGAAGSVAQGIGAMNAANYNASVLSNEAASTMSAATTRAQQEARESAQNIGQINANAGASGVDPNQGSPLSVMSDAALQGSLNQALTLWQGKTQSVSLTNQASLQKFQGMQALTGGIMGAATTAAGAIGKYNFMTSGGAPGTGSFNMWATG